MILDKNNLPYCFGNKKEFDCEKGCSVCYRCGFRRDCRSEISKQEKCRLDVGRPNQF